MYKGFKKKYEKKLLEYLTQRRQWIFLVNYDNFLTAAVMTKAGKEDEKKGVTISCLKSMPSMGIKAGRIIHSEKAKNTIQNLLESVTTEAQIKDKRFFFCFDSPCLKLTPRSLTDNHCLRSPCNSEKYQGILRDVIRESSIEGQEIIDIIPLEIRMDERLVEDPQGLTGQMEMKASLVSVSIENRNDFHECIKRTGYQCEGFVGSFRNICTAFAALVKANEYVIVMDMKSHSTDIIVFLGDQPLTIKSYKYGFQEMVVRCLSGYSNIGEDEALENLYEYFNQNIEQKAIEKNGLNSSSKNVNWLEIHELVMTQIKHFINMNEGFGDFLSRFEMEFKVHPQRMLITGIGSNIPEIDTYFKTRFGMKTEIKKHWKYQDIKQEVPASVYGMPITMATDM